MKLYIDIEVERTVSHIFNDSLKTLKIDSFKDNVSAVDQNNNYNIYKVSELKNSLSVELQKRFYKIERGLYKDAQDYELYDRTRYKYIKRGYLCEMSFNSVMGSTLFSNVGPTIPVRILFIGGMHVNIDVKAEEYGINNVIIKTFASCEITNKASMPIGSKDYRIKLKEPIYVDIVNGKIPNYYSGIR